MGIGSQVWPEHLFMPGVQEIFISLYMGRKLQSHQVAPLNVAPSVKRREHFVETRRGPGWLGHSMLIRQGCDSESSFPKSSVDFDGTVFLWEAWTTGSKMEHLKNQPELAHLCRCYFETDLLHDHILGFHHWSERFEDCLQRYSLWDVPFLEEWICCLE